MSRVFVAEELALGRRVVVKVLAPELAESLSGERFAREARLAARLQDPRIVPVLTAGAIGELPYYTMPFVEGESLRARMSRTASPGHAIPLSEAISVLRDVALALEYAHAHDVVHRDIKPENVLLSGRTAVVTDFGIAKALVAAGTGGHQRPERGSARDLQTLTQLGVSLGTPAYMAPEQAVGDTVDHRADLYAWGVMAYELLTGAHPFAGKTSAQQLIAAHVSEKPAPLGSRAHGLPAALDALVMPSLEKDPAARPQSARDVVAALDTISSQVSGGMIAATGARTHGGRGWMIAAAAVVGGIALGALLIARRSTTSAKTDSALIAVLPFRVSSADPSLGYLREGMVDLIAAKLVRSPRTVDQRSLLAAWWRAGGSATQDIDHAAAARVAAGLGAGRLIEGDIVGSTNQLTISASLASAPNGSRRGRASATGVATQLPLLVDSVMAQLLAIDAGESEQRVAALASTPLAALEAYLAGEANNRAGRYTDAGDRFADAIRIDSTFALAGLGLTIASEWTGDPRGAYGRTVAIRHGDKLGTRDRLYLGPTDPDSEETTYAEALAREEVAVQTAPDAPDLWYQLGDRQFHYGGAVNGTPEGWRRSAAALERGLALDSTYAPLLEHLPLVYGYLGDTTKAQLATVRVLRDTTVLYYPASRVIYAADSAARAASVRDLESSKRPLLAGYAAITTLIGGGDFSFADDLLSDARARSATERDRDYLSQMQFTVAMESGQPRRAARIATGLPNRLAERMFAATFWDGDSTAAAAQYAEARGLVSVGPPAEPNARRAWITTVFDVAQYELARGDTTSASRAIAQLRALPAVAHDPVESVRPGRLALILDAQLAAREARTNASPRLNSLDSLLRLGPFGDHVRLAGNLVASRLWERAGNLQRAYEAAQRWAVASGPEAGTLYATYLREQGRLGGLVGDREAAIAAYRRYLRLRARHEPSLDRDVATVRAELEKLERQSSGR
jgi:serine/threonine-protein kinase